MDGVRYELIGDCKVAVLNNTADNLDIARKIAALKDSKVTNETILNNIIIF